MVRLLALGVFVLGCATGTPAPPSTSEPADAEPAPPQPDAAPSRLDLASALEPDAQASPAPDLASASPDLAASPDGPAPVAGDRSAGCGMPAALPEGQATIPVGGGNRTYILRLPQGYASERAWPLVLALHPNGGSGIGYWDATNGGRSIRALARDKAIVVLPQARPAGGGWDWRGNLPADLAFFDALIQRLEGQLCIDRKRIFAMGFSGGGSFSAVLACRRSDIRAFASGSGVAYYDPKDCVGTAAAWMTVGSEELIAARTAFRDFWVMRNGCQPMSVPSQPSACRAYDCPKEGPVTFCVHPGGHVWPDFGTQAAWTFFQQF